MKNNKIIVVLSIAILFSFSSCSDDDIFQDSFDQTSIDNFYKNESDFTRAIYGTYNQFRGNGLFGNSGFSNDIVILGDLLSDNLILNPYGRRGNQIASIWGYDGNSTPTQLYISSYRVIANANLILSKIDNLPDGAFKSRIKSEALGARAIAHLEVVRTYAEMPTQNSSSAASIGIAYIEDFDRIREPTREATVEAVYLKIIRDLELALDGLPNQNEGNNPYRLTKNAIRGFLSRAFLYIGNYPKVIEYALPLVESVKPVDKEDLEKFWISENNDGVLFSLPFSQSNDISLGVNYSQGTSNATIRIEYSVDKSFYDLFKKETEPERLNASVKAFNHSYDNNSPTLAVNKYILARPGFNAGVNDGRYLRIEEVILSLAEAQYLLGQHNVALETLNRLRNVRYSSYLGNETGDDLFNAIIIERRKELAFEIGDRFFTLKRLLGVSGIPSEYSRGVVRSGLGHRADGTGTPSSIQVLPANSHKWQLPIPLTVLNFDKNITQTPGY